MPSPIFHALSSLLGTSQLGSSSLPPVYHMAQSRLPVDV